MKILQAGSHLDHMMRQTRAHHVQLSALADMKANALMTISALMMTLAAPYVARTGFETAAVILIAFKFVTILLATLAVMPRIPFKPTPLPPGVRPDRSFNLLFFGDFVRMDQEQYEAEMEEVLNDVGRAYEVQVREVYLLGLFLAKKKYRLLRCAYATFLAGLFLSGAALFSI